MVPCVLSLRARISEAIAARTSREFERQKALTPQAIQGTGWDGLVQILDAGGYVRYDFSTATKLLEVTTDLLRHCAGKLSNVRAAADGPRDLERRLQKIGKGVGPVTANIFLRELRGIWAKAEPMPSDLVVSAAHATVWHYGVKNSARLGATRARTEVT